MILLTFLLGRPLAPLPSLPSVRSDTVARHRCLPPETKVGTPLDLCRIG